MRLLRNRQQHEFPVFHFLDFALGDAQFRRIDEIVGGIDRTSRAP